MPLMTGDVCTIYQRPYTITLLRVRIVYFASLSRAHGTLPGYVVFLHLSTVAMSII